MADVWTLQRGTVTLRCTLATNPLGWELRLSKGNNLQRSQVCKTEDAVFDTSDTRRQEAGKKGWAG